MATIAERKAQLAQKYAQATKSAQPSSNVMTFKKEGGNIVLPKGTQKGIVTPQVLKSEVPGLSGGLPSAIQYGNNIIPHSLSIGGAGTPVASPNITAGAQAGLMNTKELTSLPPLEYMRKNLGMVGADFAESPWGKIAAPGFGVLSGGARLLSELGVESEVLKDFETIYTSIERKSPTLSMAGNLLSYEIPVYKLAGAAANIIGGIKTGDKSRVVGGMIEAVLLKGVANKIGEFGEKSGYKIIEKYIKNGTKNEILNLTNKMVASGAPVGGAFGVAGYIGSEPNPTLDGVWKAFLNGAKAGIILTGVTSGAQRLTGQKILPSYRQGKAVGEQRSTSTTKRLMDEVKVERKAELEAMAEPQRRSNMMTPEEAAAKKRPFGAPVATGKPIFEPIKTRVGEKPIDNKTNKSIIEPNTDRLTSYNERIAKATGEHKQGLIEARDNYLEARADDLMGIKNRRAFNETFTKDTGKTALDGKKIIEPTKPHILTDIDFFKKVNDKYGHDAGDKVLQHYGETLKKYFGKDNVYRYGGEEVAIDYGNMSKAEIKSNLAKVRAETKAFELQVSKRKIIKGYDFSSGEGLGKQADKNLYRSKSAGRGRDTLSSNLGGQNGQATKLGESGRGQRAGKTPTKLGEREVDKIPETKKPVKNGEGIPKRGQTPSGRTDRDGKGTPEVLGRELGNKAQEGVKTVIPETVIKAQNDIKEAQTLMKKAPNESELTPQQLYDTKTKEDYQKYIKDTQDWIDKKMGSQSQEVKTPTKLGEKPVKRPPVEAFPLIKTTARSEPTVEVEKKVSGVSKQISDAMVKEGFEALPGEALATYDSISKKEAIQKVSDLITNDIELAKEVIRGEKDGGLSKQEKTVLWNSMSKFATETKDVRLGEDLARSEIAKQISESASNLSAKGFNNFVDNPVDKLMKVNENIKKNYKQRTGKNIEKESANLTEEMKKQSRAEAKKTINLDRLNNFIDKITC